MVEGSSNPSNVVLGEMEFVHHESVPDTQRSYVAHITARISAAMSGGQRPAEGPIISDSRTAVHSRHYAWPPYSLVGTSVSAECGYEEGEDGDEEGEDGDEDGDD